MKENEMNLNQSVKNNRCNEKNMHSNYESMIAINNVTA